MKTSSRKENPVIWALGVSIQQKSIISAELFYNCLMRFKNILETKHGKNQNRGELDSCSSENFL